MRTFTQSTKDDTETFAINLHPSRVLNLRRHETDYDDDIIDLGLLEGKPFAALAVRNSPSRFGLLTTGCGNENRELHLEEMSRNCMCEKLLLSARPSFVFTINFVFSWC